VARKGPAASGAPIKIVKLGGSVITDKARDEPTLREADLKRLAREVASAGGETIVLHGAGSFGHPGAREYRLREGLSGPDSVRGASEVRASVARLNALVVEALREAGVHPWALPPSASAAMREGAFKRIDWEAFDAALGRGFTPVAHGDVVLDDTLGVSILSADDIAQALARHLHPALMVFAVNVDGLFDRDPSAPGAALIQTLKASDKVSFEQGTSKGADVTGAMAAKLKAAQAIAFGGARVRIVNGLVPGRVADALAGKDVVGTLVTPPGVVAR
jgi:isopentenyl phosphate kinase